MTKDAFDATNGRWVKNSGETSDSVATAAQWRTHSENTIPGGTRTAKPYKTKVNNPQTFTLVDWLFIGPMVVGLGFLVGVFWP